MQFWNSKRKCRQYRQNRQYQKCRQYRQYRKINIDVKVEKNSQIILGSDLPIYLCDLKTIKREKRSTINYIKT